MNRIHPAILEYVKKELLRDPAGFSEKEADEVLKKWENRKLFSPRHANALQRATDQYRAAILYGRLKL